MSSYARDEQNLLALRGEADPGSLARTAPLREVVRDTMPLKDSRPRFQARPSANPHGSLEASGRREYPFGESSVSEDRQEDPTTMDRYKRAFERRNAMRAVETPEALRARYDQEFDRDELRAAVRPFRRVASADSGQLAMSQQANPGLRNFSAFMHTKQQRDQIQGRIAQTQSAIDGSRFGLRNLGNWFSGLFRNRGRRRALAEDQRRLAALPDISGQSEDALRAQVEMESRIGRSGGGGRLFNALASRSFMNGENPKDRSILARPFADKWSGLGAGTGDPIAEADTADEDVDDEAVAGASSVDSSDDDADDGAAGQARAEAQNPDAGPSAPTGFEPLPVPSAVRRGSVGSAGQAPAEPEVETSIPGLFDTPLDDMMVTDGERGDRTAAEILEHRRKKASAIPDIANKRVLGDDGAVNAANPDIAEHSGPQTVMGLPVTMEGSLEPNPIRPGKLRNVAHWRSPATNQLLQSTWNLANGDEGESKPLGHACDEKSDDYRLQNPEWILRAPGAGWDQIGRKPGFLASSARKEEYRRRKDAADGVFMKAWNLRVTTDNRMPEYIEKSPRYAEQWEKQLAGAAQDAAYRAERQRLGAAL